MLSTRQPFGTLNLHRVSWNGSHIGRFRVDGVLGRGGMGVVLRAFDPHLERSVAIKLLTERSPEVKEGTTVNLRDRFDHDGLLAEARTLAQITDANVLAIHEIGSEQGQTFLVMELVEGEDLRQWLGSSPRTLAEIYAVFGQAARGLAAAHRRQIIHRDFKPENLLISPDGRVRVCDFGIAALARSAELIRAGTVGTPRYMAPELWGDHAASVQSDVYAFALTIAEAICGELSTDAAEVERELTRRAVDPRVRTAIVRALDPDPARRPSSIDEIARALAAKPRRRWLVPAAVLALAAGGTALALGARDHGGNPQLCGDSSRLLAARWGEQDREAVRAGVRSLTPSHPAKAEAIIERLDQYAHTWQRLRDETCTAAVPAARRPPRLACLDRRLFELGSAVRTLREPASLQMAIGRSHALADLGTCIEATEVRMPEGAATRAAIEALTSRTMAAYDAALAELGSEGDQAAFEVDREQARALGDHELAVRIDRMRAQLLGNAGKIDEAVTVLDGAYELATRHRYDSIAALVLVEAARFADLRGDLGGAKSKLQIARGHLERSTDATPYSRMLLLRGIAANAVRRGDLAAAEEALDRAERAIAEMEPRDPLWTAQLGLQRAGLLDQQGKLAEAARVAGTTELQLRALGDQGVPDLGNLLSLIARIESQRGHAELAMAARRERVAVLEAGMPADDSGRVAAEGALGLGLLDAGDYAEALAIFERTLARTKQLPALAGFRADAHNHVARAHRLLGQFERARVHVQNAIDRTRARRGARAPELGYHEITFAIIELDAGDLDRAATHLRIAEDLLAVLPAEHVNRLDLAEVQIELLLAQGKASQADELARRVLDLFAERKIDDARNERFWVVAAAARTMLGRPRDALALAQRALARRTTRAAAPLEVAAAELEVAKARYGLGDRADALATIRRHEIALRVPRTRFAHAQLVRWFHANRLAP